MFRERKTKNQIKQETCTGSISMDDLDPKSESKMENLLFYIEHEKINIQWELLLKIR